MPSPLVIEGQVFIADRSRAFDGKLEAHDLETGKVSIALADGTRKSTHIESISDRLGAVDRRIELDDGSVFVTKDNDSVDQLNRAKGGWFSQVSKIEVLHPRLIAFLLAIILLVVGFIRYGIPVAARVAVWATPPEAIVLIDNSALSTIDRILTRPSKLPEERREKLKAGFQDLIGKSETGVKAKLLFRDGYRLGANAFALPAGTIVLTDQLAKIATDEELVAVFAHELSHVKNYHGLQQLYRSLGFAALVTVISGDLGGVMEEVIGGGGLMIAMAASREMELEADAEAVALLKKAGRDPGGLGRALDKLYRQMCGEKFQIACEETGWFSSHPGGEERREALQKAIDS